MEKLNQEIIKRCGSVEKFCNSIGISRTALYNIYNLGRVTKKTLDKIADGLKISYEDLRKYIPDVCENVDLKIKLKSNDLSPEEKNKIRMEKLINQNKIISNHKSERVYPRSKLRNKVKTIYGDILEFSKESRIPSQTLYLLCRGKIDGVYDTWISIQNALKIPDEEMWGYYKKEEGSNK